MIQVNFKNLRRSQLVEEIVMSRIEGFVEKFPDLRRSRIVLALEMHNSLTKAGRDEFAVSVHVNRGRYHGIHLKKSSPNLYAALAKLSDRMLDVLNRNGDRIRVKARKQSRRQKFRTLMLE